MKTKQLIAIILALLTAAALLAGCETTIGPDVTETDPTVVPLDKGALAELMTEFDISNLEGLTPEQRKAFQDALIDRGQVPPDFVLPDDGDRVPVTMPPTLPQGVAAQTSEVYPLIKNVLEIFESRSYYFKGRASSPMGGFGSSGYSSLVMAMDKDKLMIETEIDWAAMMKIAAAESGDVSLIVQGGVLQATLGRRFRMIFSPEGMYWTFPDKERYLDLGEMLGTEDATGLADLFKDLDILGQGGKMPEDIPASKVTVDGKVYLCGTLARKDADGKTVSTARYYFLDGQLKRIEVFAETSDENMVIEIDEFSGKPDASLFSVKGYRSMALMEMAKLFGDMGEFLGGGSTPAPTAAQ